MGNLLSPKMMMTSVVAVVIIVSSVASSSAPSSSSSVLGRRSSMTLNGAALMDAPVSTMKKDLMIDFNKDMNTVATHSHPMIDTRPKYMTAPLTQTRWEFGRLLTVANKKHEDMGIKLRKKYVQMRQLTREEELTCGKVSAMGHTLERIRDMLSKKLEREPTMVEWSGACKLSVDELENYRTSSRKARHRLVQHNMRLVDFWVRRLLEHTKAAQVVSYYELVLAGTRGLSAAAEKYDGRGTFIRYAQHYVRAELYKGLAQLRPEKNTISQNGRATMIFLRASKATKLLKKKFIDNGEIPRTPTDAEVAKYLQSTGLHVSEATIKWAKAVQNVHIVSADTSLGGDTVGDDMQQNTYLDLFMKADQSTDHSVDKLMWRVDFQVALECLTPVEKRTVMIRYGLLPDGKPRSVGRTAELMCVTPEAIRLIVHSALEKLRTCPNGECLAEGPPLPPLTTTSGRLGAISY